MATSGTTTPSTNTSNWKIYVEWERTGYDVDKLEVYIRARLHLGYYTTTGVNNKAAYIKINNIQKATTLSAAQNWWQQGDTAPFAYRSTSDWLYWTLPLPESGNMNLDVYGSFPLNFWNIANQCYENPTTGTNTWALDHIDTYSKMRKTTNNGGNWTKNIYVHKTTDYGANWKKCNAYKTTNSGGSWGKIN